MKKSAGRLHSCNYFNFSNAVRECRDVTSLCGKPEFTSRDVTPSVTVAAFKNLISGWKKNVPCLQKLFLCPIQRQYFAAERRLSGESPVLKAYISSFSKLSRPSRKRWCNGY